jgi:hypothetical protein
MLHKIGAICKESMQDFDTRHLIMTTQIEPAQIKSFHC